MKRLADDYAKKIADLVGMRRHDGPFTFKDYEKYLYCESIRSDGHGTLYVFATPRPPKMETANAFPSLT